MTDTLSPEDMDAVLSIFNKDIASTTSEITKPEDRAMLFDFAKHYQSDGISLRIMAQLHRKMARRLADFFNSADLPIECIVHSIDEMRYGDLTRSIDTPCNQIVCDMGIDKSMIIMDNTLSSTFVSYISDEDSVSARSAESHYIIEHEFVPTVLRAIDDFLPNNICSQFDHLGMVPMDINFVRDSTLVIVVEFEIIFGKDGVSGAMTVCYPSSLFNNIINLHNHENLNSNMHIIELPPIECTKIGKVQISDIGLDLLPAETRIPYSIKTLPSFINRDKLKDTISKGLVDIDLPEDTDVVLEVGGYPIATGFVIIKHGKFGISISEFLTEEQVSIMNSSYTDPTMAHNVQLLIASDVDLGISISEILALDEGDLIVTAIPCTSPFTMLIDGVDKFTGLSEVIKDRLYFSIDDTITLAPQNHKIKTMTNKKSFSLFSKKPIHKEKKVYETEVDIELLNKCLLDIYKNINNETLLNNVTFEIKGLI